MPMPIPMDLSDDDLLAMVQGPAGQSASWSAHSYLEEFNRRTVDRQTKELISLTAGIRSLTSQIRTLTWIVVVVGVLSVGLAAYAILRPPPG